MVCEPRQGRDNLQLIIFHSWAKKALRQIAHTLTGTGAALKGFSR